MCHPAEFRPTAVRPQRAEFGPSRSRRHALFYRVADQLGRATWTGVPPRSGDHAGLASATAAASLARAVPESECNVRLSGGGVLKPTGPVRAGITSVDGRQ